MLPCPSELRQWPRAYPHPFPAFSLPKAFPNAAIVSGSEARRGNQQRRTFFEHGPLTSDIQIPLKPVPPNTALTTAPLLRATVAAIWTRAVLSTVPVGGCGSAWVR